MLPKEKKSRLWLLGAVILYATCFAFNLAGAWFEYGPATGWNLMITLSYILFWVLFTRDARGSRGRTRVASIVAALTLLGGMIALMARAPVSWLLVIPALALTPFSGLPMYGLRVFCSWNVTYMLTGLMGGLWLMYLIWKGRDCTKV